MKILLYCQHVLGIGHFFRSMEIARALHRHEVLFAEGGDPLPGFTPPEHVRRLVLPPIMMDSQFQSIELFGRDPEEIKEERKTLLMDAFLRFAPDVFITELFPFGRKQFRYELMPILHCIREKRLPTKVVCSLRDVLVEKKDRAGYERGVIEILNSFFHLLMVHSDPRLISLDESFERLGDIAIPVRYTGFIVRPAPLEAEQHAGRVIVASSGGGKVGVDLLIATIHAMSGIPDEDLRLRIFLGPFMEKADRDVLADLASGDIRIRLEPFSLDFPAELARSDLSISMAGYNTCMDILGTGVRAIVYPFSQNREQAMRAGKLERLGLVRVLRGLSSEELVTAIRDTLGQPVPSSRTTVNLSGSSNAAAAVEALQPVDFP